MFIFDADDLTLNKLPFNLQCLLTFHVGYLYWTCYLVFAFHFSGVVAMGLCLEGINKYKINYDAIQ